VCACTCGCACVCVWPKEILPHIELHQQKKIKHSVVYTHKKKRCSAQYLCLDLVQPDATNANSKSLNDSAIPTVCACVLGRERERASESERESARERERAEERMRERMGERERGYAGVCVCVCVCVCVRGGEGGGGGGRGVMRVRVFVSGGMDASRRVCW